jgi:hypothetical protein
VDVKPNCELVGATCATHSDCCTANCDPDTKVCTNPTAPCKAAGEGCTLATECCTTVCTADGVCGEEVCITDNEPCTDDALCCSGTCEQGDGGTFCVPLNPECLTTGNACTDHGDCCSKFCDNGRCDPSPSFCTQTGDVCSSGAQCCSGVCTIAEGASLGLCVLPLAPGVPGCAVAGEVCGTGALPNGDPPACGGECCSRSCAPYGLTGVFVCQPPSGCRPTGEACRDDADCCGSDGMTGGNGSVTCSKEGTNELGRCDNGNACRPSGAVCKLATSSCNAENNCCAGNVNTDPTVCQQDNLGIPRCTYVGECDDTKDYTGLECATSADCCGLPCVPNSDPNGPAFICGENCVPEGGACTTDADCCFSLPCVTPPGSAQGICGYTPPLDGGVPDGDVPDADIPDGPDCALYGQECVDDEDCCYEVPCTNGRCNYPVY